MNHTHTLVLMPGLDGTGKLFAPIIPFLQPHFNLVIVTYPDLDSFSEYIDCARSQLPRTGNFSLLAESFSGPVAMAIMAERTGRIDPSVLSSTFARSPLTALTRMAAYVPEQMFSIGALSDFCLDVYEVSDEDFSETQPLPLNVTEQLDGVLLRHRISILSRIDVSALLPKIEIPILYLHGTQDRIVSETDASILQSYLPDVNRIDIDAPHLLLQTRPQQSAELIFNHLRASV
ncbi:MAG: alpha/beta fold hydrolase [Gammaproteobacteria bacterium]